MAKQTPAPVEPIILERLVLLDIPKDDKDAIERQGQRESRNFQSQMRYYVRQLADTIRAAEKTQE
jgi:hypothetical protein